MNPTCTRYLPGLDTQQKISLGGLAWMCLACLFAPIPADFTPTRRSIFRRSVGLAVAPLLAEAVFPNGARAAEPRSSHLIFTGGDILTMVGAEPETVEALVVANGRIAFVGSADEAMRHRTTATQLVDLAGRTMMPGFIDAHGHMLYYGKNLFDAVLTGVADIPELVSRMQAQAAKVAAGDWIVGMGYAPLKMAERRHPTAAELDAVSGDRPVLVVHSSGHGGSMNHAMMRLLSIDETTPDPAGGEYIRIPGGRMPAGPMEETALIDVRNRRPPLSGSAADTVMTQAAAEWARHGHTTAMECGVGLGADDAAVIVNAIDRQLLPIDLVVFAKDDQVDQVTREAYGVGAAYGLQAEGGAPSCSPSVPTWIVATSIACGMAESSSGSTAIRSSPGCRSRSPSRQRGGLRTTAAMARCPTRF